MELVKQIRDKGEAWETTWHVLYLTKEEANKVFLDGSDAQKGWRRTGPSWTSGSHESWSYLKKEVDQWCRENMGPPEGETWECDRFYYPDEERPEIPAGGRAEFIKRFKCWPEEFGSYHHHRWGYHRIVWMDKPKARVYIAFRDSETLPVLFATMFL